MTTQLPQNILSEMVTSAGLTVSALSHERPVMLVFLRHFGCTFCREALAEISAKRVEMERMGSTIVFVHMSDATTAERYFARYQMPGIAHVSDPECRFYRAFGLKKGTPRQLFGLQSWIRGFEAGVVEGHGIGPQLGDGFQMPGVFTIFRDEIKSSFIHKLASSRPDYVNLVQECCALD